MQLYFLQFAYKNATRRGGRRLINEYRDNIGCTTYVIS